MRIPALVFLGFLCVFSVRAEVVSSGDSGFTISHTQSTAATPGQIYQAISQIQNWWDGAHSWTADAANLYMDVRLGGCFCERLPSGGGVEHLRIIFLKPENEIRLVGALGPLQEMGLHGAMLWKWQPNDGDGHSITFKYTVSGHAADGVYAGIAPAVDGVIGAALTRLVAYVDSSLEN